MVNTVSVIIPSFNGKNLLAKNLPIVLKYCRDCEIIIVDDASTDKTPSVIKHKFPRIKVIINRQNIGFGASVNKGIKKARGKYILILNNDVVPKPGFLNPLIGVLAKNDNIFSVGSLERSEDKVKPVSGKAWFKIKHGMLVHGRSARQEEGETAWAQGGSMLVRKKDFLSLGGFDPIFAPGYWEDIDIAWRAKEAGFINWFCAESQVVHEHGTTFNKRYSYKKIKTLSYRNSFLFCWKNFKNVNLLNHFLWLPYNLIFISAKSKGLYLKAFFQACLRILTYQKLNAEKI